MITWTSLLAVACVGVSLANAAAVWVAWDRVAFPHAMLSDYAAADARVVNSAWPVYIVCHAAVEWRLLKHVRSAPESRLKSAWVLSWYFLVLGWASMVGCLVFDIVAYPAIHSVLGGVYGGSWLLAQGVRAVWVDGDREALGLAAAPRAAALRKTLCSLELGSAPLLSVGMLLPEGACPDWLSWVCVLAEHLLWVHARTLLAGMSYAPDARLLDASEAAAAAPRLKRRSDSSQNLKELLSALERSLGQRRSRKNAKPRKRLGFRSTVLRGL
mmetsp:Transcript_8044/g.25191  ORF Transcript_8044/g.25191 Transcript_8044/m.25191 type:complete len:271 (+) Transcript_8044:170-982(+)